MLQNMVGVRNKSDQFIQYKLDTFKNTMINGGISMIGLEKLNSNWNKNLIKDNIYNKMDKEVKTRRIIIGYNQITISGKQFQIGITSIMAVEKVSCRAITTGQ